METTKLGIIGLGRLGLEHAKNIHSQIPEAELAMVCSVVDAELEKASEIFPDAAQTKKYSELFANHKLDGVVIATNSQTHQEMICAAVDAGVMNIYTEKPIVKFAPTSGGFIADMMTHDYDTARWFTGSEAETIYGVGGVYAYQGLKACGDMDNTSILMKFRNGVMVILTASRNSAYGYHAPMEIFGTKGSIRIGDYSFNTRNVYSDESGVSRHCSEWFYEYWRDSYRAEMKGFVDCIKNGTKPRVTFTDGYKAVEWALLADEALRKGRVAKLNSAVGND